MTRWLVSRWPSGRAKIIEVASSGWTTASRPIVSATAWPTKPRASAAIPASQTGLRAIRSSRPELEPSDGLGLVEPGLLLQHRAEREQQRGGEGEGDVHRAVSPSVMASGLTIFSSPL